MRQSKTNPRAAKRSQCDDVDALLSKARKGDKKAMQALRPRLAESGHLQRYGELAEGIQRVIVERMCGEDLVFVEGVLQRLKRMRLELAGPAPSPLESLVIERIMTCWLEINYYDALYVQSMGDLNIRQANSSQRRQDRAHRRYLSAIRCLAAIRRLQIPMVQVNIGEKQINMVQPAGQLAPGQSHQ